MEIEVRFHHYHNPCQTDIPFTHLKKLANKYQIRDLIAMIEQVKEAVSQWSSLAKQYDLKPAIIAEIQHNYLNRSPVKKYQK
jgi:hypothetical protein